VPVKYKVLKIFGPLPVSNYLLKMSRPEPVFKSFAFGQHNYKSLKIHYRDYIIICLQPQKPFRYQQTGPTEQAAEGNTVKSFQKEGVIGLFSCRNRLNELLSLFFRNR
jgi:hypothetical protein